MGFAHNRLTQCLELLLGIRERFLELEQAPRGL
jgi:hypothetical protein